MQLIQYVHDKKLKHVFVKRRFCINETMFRQPKNTILISFSPVEGNISTRKFIVNGTSRFMNEFDGDVALINVQNDSALYAHLLWDIAHQLKVGQYLYIKEAIATESMLERAYYHDAFQRIETGESEFDVYEKVQLLPVEKEQGLDQWSFCIPVGPDEPTFLNACVERILELDVPQKEILLCGMPHPDFKYFDKVRIVGTDIPAPPVHITRKKNVLAQEARYENLCIIHDRVLLPSNFWSAMVAFGDHYPLTGLQSFYFVDRHNLIPRKYSDFNSIEQDLTRELDIHHVSKKDIPLISKLFYCYQHPARSQFGHDYLTGSLYIAKKSLWQFCPQNEALYWNDYEDIEHGIRASAAGIPSIINPHTLTQSMNARSVIHYYGYVSIRDYRGKEQMSRSLMELLPFVGRKPLFRISDEDARKRMYAFAKKYGVTKQTLLKVTSAKMSGMGRYLLIKAVMKEVTVQLSCVSEFIDDFSRNILCEEMAPNELIKVVRIIFSSASPDTKKGVLVGSFILNNQLFHSYVYSPFYRKKTDWFIKKNSTTALCTWISAFYLKHFYKGTHLPMKVSEIAKLLSISTPYLR